MASPAGVVRASTRWARSYPLAPRYRAPALPLRLRSADRTRLAAVWVPGPADAIASAVVVHGFSNWSRSREVHAAVGQLATWAHVVIAHDPHERVFGPEHAEALFAWAGEPKELWWVPGGGHGRSMLTPELLERVRVTVRERLAAAPAPARPPASGR